MKPSAGVVIALFGVAQIALALSGFNGPFVDEGIYATLGARVLRGFAEDHSWLGGSVWLYPLLSGAAYLAGGLAASRLTTALLYCCALVFFERFAREVVGRPAASWATALLCLNGVFFSMAHLAVYDGLAFLGLCGALSSLVLLSKQPRLSHSLSLAAFAALTVLSKYFAVVALAGLVPLAFVLMKRPHAKWIMLSAGAASAAVLAFVRATEGVWFPMGAVSAVAKQEVVPAAFVAARVFWFGGAAMLLAGFGAARCLRHAPGLTTALVSAALFWPVLHIAVGSHVSLHKHVVYGFVYLYPLAGKLVAELWQQQRNRAAVLLVGLGLLGAGQAYVQDRAWSDIRPLANFLKKRVQVMDRVAFEWAWGLALYTVVDGPLASPSQLLDHFGDDRQALCESAWIVTTEGPGLLHDSYSLAARRCGFVPVARFPASVWYLTPPFARLGRWDFTVYERAVQ